MNDNRTSHSTIIAMFAALSGCSDGFTPSPDGGAETAQVDVDGIFTRSMCAGAPLPGAHCGRIRTDEAGVPLRAGSPTAFATPTLGATDLLQAYNVQRDTSHHPTVAVLAMGDYADAETDLAAYRTYYGLPACASKTGCFTKLNKDGATSRCRLRPTAA